MPQNIASDPALHCVPRQQPIDNSAGSKVDIFRFRMISMGRSDCVIIQCNLNGSNTDGFFTVDDSN